MKNILYTPITPKDVFAPYSIKTQIGPESETGPRLNEFGNYYSGCIFIDKFAGMIRAYGLVRVEFIAKKMGVKKDNLSYTIKTLTGISPKEWIDWWVLIVMCELLEHTNLSMSEIAKRMRFTSVYVMSSYFSKHKKMPPTEWRYICRH